MVLEALVPVRAVEQANKIFPMLGGRSNLGKEVRQQVEDIKLEISAAVAEAKEAGCKFALSTDSWKSKTVKHRHFICILLDWVSTCWERFSTCVHVSEIRAPRTAEKYQEHIRAALEEMGLVLDDITCVLTDHESAVRAAARSFNNALGCACHALQLPMKHCLPPLRNRNTGAAPSSGSSSSDSSNSSSASSSSSTSSSNRAPRGRRRDPEHVAMQAALAPLVKKARKLLKWFLHNPDEYIFMEEQAKQNNLSFISFRRETATRWSSTQDMMMSLVRNAPAMQVYAQTQGRSKQSFPGVLTDAEIKELSQLATVMHPFLTCTRMMEGARTPCSLYLVLVHQLKAAMINRARDMKVPQELHKQCGKALRGRDLLPLPKRLAAFLAADLDKVCKKHIANTTAQDLLAMATYLDPRFRTHAALSMEERAKAKQSVAEWAYKTHEAGPELEAHMQEVAAHPDNRRLEDLIQPAASSRGRGRGRGRNRGRQGRARGGKIAPPSSVVLPKRVGRALKQVDSTDDFVFGPSSSTAGVNPDEDKAQADECLRASIQHQLDHLDTLPAQTSLKLDPLQWWQSRAFEMPDVARIARFLLGIPGSTASVERAFSSAGRIINRRRPRLAADMGARILYGHENLKRGFTGEEFFQKRLRSAKAEVPDAAK